MVTLKSSQRRTAQRDDRGVLHVQWCCTMKATCSVAVVCGWKLLWLLSAGPSCQQLTDHTSTPRVGMFSIQQWCDARGRCDKSNFTSVSEANARAAGALLTGAVMLPCEVLCDVLDIRSQCRITRDSCPFYIYSDETLPPANCL